MRMDAEMYRSIEEIAKENKRSVAKEIQIAVDLYIMQVKSNQLTQTAEAMHG